MSALIATKGEMDSRLRPDSWGKKPERYDLGGGGGGNPGERKLNGKHPA